MTDSTELTIRDYLHKLHESALQNDQSLTLRMCRFLSMDFDSATCEGPAESFDECDVDTSVTYRKSTLDWAYEHVHSTLH